MTNDEILLLFHLAFFIAGCSFSWIAFDLIHRNNKK